MKTFYIELGIIITCICLGCYLAGANKSNRKQLAEEQAAIMIKYFEKQAALYEAEHLQIKTKRL